MLTLDKVYQASQVLREVIRETDMILAPNIHPGTNVYLKTENLQVTGSFKIRGSYYKISKLTDEEKARGVIACSGCYQEWYSVFDLPAGRRAYQ